MNKERVCQRVQANGRMWLRNAAMQKAKIMKAAEAEARKILREAATR